MQEQMKKKVCIIGSGKWGTAVAKLIAENIKHSEVFDEEVKLYVYEEIYNNQKLSEIINNEHTNPKYLPNIQLPENITAVTCAKTAVENSDVLVFVLRQQFLGQVCESIKGTIKANAIGISLTKSLYHDPKGGNRNDLQCGTDIIKEKLNMDVSVLMGPNLADEIAKGKFSETTIGCTDECQFPIWKELFTSQYFVVRFCKSIREVELCGALKNIVAAAAGICDGLGCGENCKAAIIRLGFQEIKQFISFILHGQVNELVYWEPCGFADLIATCYGGLTRKLVEKFIESDKTLKQIEAEDFSGMVLEGPENVKQAYLWLKTENHGTEKFPLLSAVYGVFHEQKPPQSFIEVLKSSF